MTKEKFFREIKSLFAVVVVVIGIRTFLIEPICVPTGSLKMTILEQDFLFSTKYNYGYSKHSIPFSPNIFRGRILKSKPKRGDIIVFKSEHDDFQKRYIKRLIGLPGDKIQVVNNLLYINEKPVPREYVGKFTDDWGNIYDKYVQTLPEGLRHNIILFPSYHPASKSLASTEVFYVPEESYFFMGDNYNDSNDSRADIGFVSEENLIAKAQFVFFSDKVPLFDWKEGSILPQINLWQWLTSIRWNRLFHNIYSL